MAKLITLKMPAVKSHAWAAQGNHAVQNFNVVDLQSKHTERKNTKCMAGDRIRLRPLDASLKSTR